MLGDVVARNQAAALAESLTEEPRMPYPRIILLAKDPDSVVSTDFNFPIHAVLRKPLLRSEPVLRAMTESSESLVPFNFAADCPDPLRLDPSRPASRPCALSPVRAAAGVTSLSTHTHPEPSS